MPSPALDDELAPPVPVARDTASRKPQPKRELWDTADDLEPWEEIPVRLSLVDRAGADLGGPWRVVVTSLFASSGATTVTTALGLVLADTRGGGVVAIDASMPGMPGQLPSGDRAADVDDQQPALGVSLTRRLGAPAATTVTALARHRRSGCPPEEVGPLVAGTPTGSAPGTLDIVATRTADTRPAAGATGGALVPADDMVTPTSLRSALGLLGEAYPLLLLDAAGDSPLEAAALRGADLVLLVVLAIPADLDAAAADLRDPGGLASQLTEPPPAVIAVVVSARRGRWSPQTRAAAARLRRRVDGLVRVPYDARLDLDAGSPTKIGRLRRSTRRAFLNLAADVVDILVDEADARAVEPTATPASNETVAPYP